MTTNATLDYVHAARALTELGFPITNAGLRYRAKKGKPPQFHRIGDRIRYSHADLVRFVNGGMPS
jgi:hypothetical protein